MQSPKVLLIVLIFCLFTFLSLDLMQVAMTTHQSRDGARDMVENVLYESLEIGTLRTRHVVRIDPEKASEVLPKWTKRNIGKNAQVEAFFHPDRLPMIALEVKVPMESVTLKATDKFTQEDEPEGHEKLEVKTRVIGIWDDK